MKGLLNPKNAIETAGGFKEGTLQVDSAAFKVHQNKVSEGRVARAPVLALVWGVTRLDEETLQPLVDEDGNPERDVLPFSLGGKALAQIHPGKADSAEDEEAEDLGAEINTEGPTVYLVNTGFKLNSKSACNQLMESLKKAGFKEQYLDRVWAPDFIGSIFHMKTFVSAETMTGDDGKERPISYKIVDKIIRASYEKRGTAATPVLEGKKSTKSEANGDAAEAAVSKILAKLSETLDGQKLSRKALATRVSGLLQSDGVAAKLHVPALSLIKDENWLKKNAGLYDITYNAEEGTVVFGTLAE